MGLTTEGLNFKSYQELVVALMYKTPISAKYYYIEVLIQGTEFPWPRSPTRGFRYDDLTGRNLRGGLTKRFDYSTPHDKSKLKGGF